jgi:hypothetical protein
MQKNTRIVQRQVVPKMILLKMAKFRKENLVQVK